MEGYIPTVFSSSGRRYHRGENGSLGKCCSTQAAYFLLVESRSHVVLTALVKGGLEFLVFSLNSAWNLAFAAMSDSTHFISIQPFPFFIFSSSGTL